MSVTVTIGLPFYNNEDTLADAIRSVFAQNFEDWELLLVDDGSSDNSLEIARAVDDPRVHVFSDGHNRKLPARLNEIADRANGEFLARLDADDLLQPDRILLQLNLLRQNPEVSLVDTGMYLITEENELLGVRGLGPLQTRPDQVLRSAMLNHATITGRTEWFRNNKYNTEFDRRQDYELWCRTCRHSQFARIRKPLYFVRKGPTEPRKYLASLPYYRKIFHMHGPSIVGWPMTLLLVAETYFTGAACVILDTLGLQRLIKARKATPLDEEQRHDAQRALKTILAAEIPLHPAADSAAFAHQPD